MDWPHTTPYPPQFTNSHLKGAGLDALEWTTLYGVFSKLGATNIYPVKPKDAFASLVSHLVFGATKITITVMLGDERLFKPKNLSLEINEPQDLFHVKKPSSKYNRPISLQKNKRLLKH